MYYSPYHQESNIKRVLRQHPVLTIACLALLISFMAIFTKPAILYTANALQRHLYHNGWHGAEDSEQAQAEWNEIMAQQDSISQMSKGGEWIMNMSSFERCLTIVAVIAAVFGIVALTLILCECILDNCRDICRIARKVRRAICVVLYRAHEKHQRKKKAKKASKVK